MPSLEELEKKGYLHEFDNNIIRLKDAMQDDISSEDLEEPYLNTQRHMPEVGLPLVGFITSFCRKLFNFTKLFIKVAVNKTLNGIEWVIKFSENVDISALEDGGMDFSDLKNIGDDRPTRGVRHYTNRQNKRKKQNKHNVKQKTKTIIVEGVKIEVPIEKQKAKKKKKVKNNTTISKRRPISPRHEETIFDRIERMEL